MLVWLLVQLAALLLAAYRVPLAAQYPQPGEFQAVRLMLAVQFSALALLSRWMLRTRGSALAVSAAGWAMLLAAAVLSAWTIRAALPLGAFLTAWIVIFATLAHVRSIRLQSIIMALAGAYVMGGPLLWYLQLEFASALSANAGLSFGPLLAAIATPPHLSPSAWAGACGAECLALLARKTGSRPSKRGDVAGISG